MKKKATDVLHDIDEMEVTPSAMKIPEILQHIFEFNDQKSNCNSNVLVCKAWSDPCMNVIWREITDITRLVRILGDITSSYPSVCFPLITYPGLVTDILSMVSAIRKGEASRLE